MFKNWPAHIEITFKQFKIIYFLAKSKIKYNFGICTITKTVIKKTVIKILNPYISLTFNLSHKIQTNPDLNNI